MSDSILLEIVERLPFRPSDNRYLVALIEKLLTFVKGYNRKEKLERLRNLLKNPRLARAYRKVDFEMSYEAHKLQYDDLVLRGSANTDKLFIDISQNIFEKVTGRKRRNNEEAFLVFASFIRRRRNHEDWLSQQRAQPKKVRVLKPRTPVLGQYSLYK